MSKKAKRKRMGTMPTELRRRWEQAVRETEAEKDDIMMTGRAIMAARESARKALKRMKRERERQGLSLADMRERTGMSREAISRMENDKAPNPTLKTLQRYALALGLELRLSVTKPRNT